MAQVTTTSWTGTSNTSWTNSLNWTAGVPTGTVNAVLGDASFTGNNQPAISANAACLNLTLGGTKATTLSNSKALTISGNLVINTGSTLDHGKGGINISGNWTNNGSYSVASLSLTTFKGSAQTIGGTSASGFRKVTINAGTIVTFITNISASSTFSLYGTLIPAETINPVLSGSQGSLSVYSGATLKINAPTFAGNYTIPTGLAGGSIFEYSSSVTSQTIISATYSTLTISGGTTKTLAGNITLSAALSSHGNIFVNSGTLDMSLFTANRATTTVGGSLILAVLTTLKIAGLTTSFFPANFNSVSLALSSNVEYNGGSGTQIVSSQSYGNLILNGTAGTSARTMPAQATINGNLVSKVSGGTALTYTATGNITVSGNDSIGTSTTFNGGSSGYTCLINGNLYNNGTITGNTNSTITMGGAGFLLSGSGTNNFNNFIVNASGITANTNPINVSGNLSLGVGSASFMQASGGILNMTGSSGQIIGNNFTFANLNVATGASVSTVADFTVAGNFSTTGTGAFSATAGTITISGISRTIATGGLTTFNSLVAATGGSVSTSSNFTVNSMLIVQGSFTASAGVATFGGVPSSLSGTANLFDVTVPFAKTLQLNNNAILGVGGTFTTIGTLNTSGSPTNTVIYNGVTATQTIAGLSYNNLTVANGNTKNAAAVINVAGDFTLNSSTTFNAGTFSHIIQKNFTNNGTFDAGTGAASITFSGTNNAIISGATTFNTITVDKTSATAVITLVNNVSAATVNITSGNISTGINTLSITSTRTGSGLITGTVTRTHAFVSGTPYAFEGPNNLITFTGSPTSVTEKITTGSISDFPFGGAINRVYDITSVSGTYTSATLRLHYEDVELNGNNEATMALWHYNGSAWSTSGQTSNDATNNYVELTGITALTNRWTLSDNNSVISWKGTTSTDWFTGSNWTGGISPLSTNIVAVGDENFTGNFQPIINSSAVAKSIAFESLKASTLTLTTGGSLTVSGNISGEWTVNREHNIITNAQNLTVNGDFTLSDGNTGHLINLTIGTGTVAVAGSFTQTGGASVAFAGAGNLNIGNNFNYVSGVFTAGSGTLTYNGTNAQTVAAVTYNNLVVNKATGIASINNTTIGGNLTAAAGELDVNAATTVTGNVIIGASGKLVKTTSDILYVGGNWTNNGIFSVATGSVIFNGSGTQTLTGATSFNNLVVTKTTGSSLVLAANVSVNNDLIVNSGILDINTFTANRAASGGTFTLANDASLYVSGANNFPSNYITYAMDTAASGNSSTVLYNGSVAQSVAAVSYGNLSFSGAGTKTFTANGNTTVKGNFNVNASSTVDASSNVITLWGNWVNSGTFTPSTSTILFYGVAKTTSGNTTFYKSSFYGRYTNLGFNLTFIFDVRVITGGTFNAGSGLITISGDYTNNGTNTSTGTITFSGTVLQTIRVQNALVSSAAGIVNFNGTIAPVLNSNTNTNFATVNINNSAGISPSLPWSVFVALNVASNSSWNGGAFAHNFYGSFTNNGTVTSSGTLNFTPTTAQALKFAGTSFTSTGSVVISGRASVTTTGSVPTFADITIANSTGVSPGTDWNITGSFITRDTAIFNAGSNTYTVAGNVNSSGTLNPGTSVFNMTGTTGGSINGSNNTSFYDLTLASGANIVAETDFNISRNLTTTGNFSAAFSTGVINFTGGMAAVISGTGTRLPQFNIEKSSGVTVTLSRNIDSLQIMIITSGILDAGTYVITQDPTALSVNTMQMYSGGTFRTGGVFPALSLYTLDSLSTVEYYSGSAQTIKSLSTFVTDTDGGSAYGNLTVSGAGTKTANGPLNIRNNFALTTATVLFNNFADTLGGNWNMSSGIFTPGSGLLVFNGGANQTVLTTGAFSNLKINKPAGYVSLLSNMAASGSVTFTSGKIYTNAFSFSVTSAGGAVTGAAQATGWVNGNLLKVIGTGAVSKTYEVGGALNYSPIGINFANVTTGGNLTGKATATEHPQILNSGLDSSKSVNRYFTLTNSGIVFSTASATLNWVSADVDPGANTASFIASRYTGSSWSMPTVSSPQATSIQVTGLTSFGDLAIGERGAKAWTGLISSSWNTDGNWNPTVIPAVNEDVLIPIGSTVNIDVPVTTNNLTVSNTGVVVTISSGNTLTVNGNLYLANGIMNINGQTLTLNGTFNGSSSNSIRGSKTSALIIGSGFTTPSTSLFFDQTAATFNNYLKTFTVNKTVTVGNALNISADANSNAGTISLASGATLNTGGFITLKSDNLGTARIGSLPVDGSGIATAFISGDVTIERYIPSRRTWRLLSVPIRSANAPTLNASWQEGTTSASVTPNPNPGFGTHITGGTVANGFDQGLTLNSSIKYYDTALALLKNLPNTNIPITNYPGYFMFVRGDRSISLAAGSSAPPTNTVLRMKGQVNTGRVSNIVLKGRKGNTLIANPYPSPIDFGTLTRSNVANVIYIWDPKLAGNYAIGGYVTGTYNTNTSSYVFTGSVSPVSQYIPSGESFYVVSSDTSLPGSITINETDKTTQGSDQVFGRTALDGASVRVNILSVNADSSTTLDDGLLVLYNDDNTNNVTAEDAKKLSNSGENISLINSGSLLSIEQRKTFTTNDTLRINCGQLRKITYRFNITLDGLNTNGLTALLKDNYAAQTNNTVLAPSGNTSVDFIVNTDPLSFASDRFSIVFITAQVLPVTYTSVSAYRLQKDIIVKWKTENEINMSSYDVETSTDGVHFTTVTNIIAHTQPGIPYSGTNSNPGPGVHFYRIKGIGNDGNKIYSSIVKVAPIDNETSEIKVYDSRSSSSLTLILAGLIKGNYNVTLYDMTGRLLQNYPVIYTGGTDLYNIPSRNYPAGAYQVKITSAKNNYSASFIKY